MQPNDDSHQQDSLAEEAGPQPLAQDRDIHGENDQDFVQEHGTRLNRATPLDQAGPPELGRTVVRLGLLAALLAGTGFCLWTIFFLPASSSQKVNKPPLIVLASPSAWQRFAGTGASIELPADFKLSEGVAWPMPDGSSPELTPTLLRTTREDVDNVRVFMLFSHTGAEQAGLTTVSIMKEDYKPGAEKNGTGMLLRMVIDRCICEREGVAVLLEEDVIELPAYIAGRAIILNRIDGKGFQHLIYVIKSKDGLWSIKFTTYAPYFEQLLPVFEQSIRTFVIDSVE